MKNPQQRVNCKPENRKEFCSKAIRWNSIQAMIKSVETVLAVTERRESWCGRAFRLSKDSQTGEWNQGQAGQDPGIRRAFDRSGKPPLNVITGVCLGD